LAGVDAFQVGARGIQVTTHLHSQPR